MSVRSKGEGKVKDPFEQDNSSSLLFVFIACFAGGRTPSAYPYTLNFLKYPSSDSSP